MNLIGARPARFRRLRVLVVDDEFRLRGLITVKDILKSHEHPLANKDASGRLRAGAAVGVGAGTEERVELLAEAGIDVVVVDTAHGHSQGVLDRVKWVKKNFPQIEVIGGNIATADAARALVDHGADGVVEVLGPFRPQADRAERVAAKQRRLRASLRWRAVGRGDRRRQVPAAVRFRGFASVEEPYNDGRLTCPTIGLLAEWAQPN